MPTAFRCSWSASTTSLASAPTSGGCSSRRLVAPKRITQAVKQAGGKSTPAITSRGIPSQAE